MADSLLDTVVRGVDECISAVEEMQAAVDAATLAGLKTAQKIAKKSVKAGMRGRPRWNHRGKIGEGKGGEAVTLSQYPSHSTRSGGPGRLTGNLSRAVGTVKRPKRNVTGTYSGGIGAGGPSSITNIYRKEVNKDYPYIKPGVDKAQPKIQAAYEELWAKATEV